MTSFGSIFKKWMLKNLSKTFEFKKPIEIVLLQDKCKLKFINELGNYLIDELKKENLTYDHEILDLFADYCKYPG